MLKQGDYDKASDIESKITYLRDIEMKKILENNNNSTNKNLQKFVTKQNNELTNLHRIADLKIKELRMLMKAEMDKITRHKTNVNKKLDGD